MYKNRFPYQAKPQSLLPRLVQEPLFVPGHTTHGTLALQPCTRTAFLTRPHQIPRSLAVYKDHFSYTAAPPTPPSLLSYSRTQSSPALPSCQGLLPSSYICWVVLSGSRTTALSLPPYITFLLLLDLGKAKLSITALMSTQHTVYFLSPLGIIYQPFSSFRQFIFTVYCRVVLTIECYKR